MIEYYVQDPENLAYPYISDANDKIAPYSSTFSSECKPPHITGRKFIATMTLTDLLLINELYQ